MVIYVLPKDKRRVRFPYPAHKNMVKKSDYYKISVGVPLASADTVRHAMGASGAGKQGKYDFCSFSQQGIGRFRPLKDAYPSIGTTGKLEEVEEEMIETICHKDLLTLVVSAIREAHPYEEPAIDISSRFELE